MSKEKLISRLFAVQVVYNLSDDCMKEIRDICEEYYNSNTNVLSYKFDLEKMLSKYDRKCICGEMNSILNQNCKKCNSQL